MPLCPSGGCRSTYSSSARRIETTTTESLALLGFTKAEQNNVAKNAAGRALALAVLSSDERDDNPIAETTAMRALAFPIPVP